MRDCSLPLCNGYKDLTVVKIKSGLGFLLLLLFLQQRLPFTWLACAIRHPIDASHHRMMVLIGIQGHEQSLILLINPAMKVD